MKYTGIIDWLTKNIDFLSFSLREGESYVDPETGEIKNRANLTAWFQHFGVGTLILSFCLYMLIRLMK